MKEVVEIGEVLNDIGHWLIIDVRSPGEFIAGHIPGAINIPLFTDEERARVGTLYKQTSPEEAMREGLKISGARMPGYLDAIKPYLSDHQKNKVIHCWRGGKRSQAMHWLFNFSGIEATRLEGGYKSYRNRIHSYFSDLDFDFRILGGYTGSGKTEILKELGNRDQQVVDLEKLAHHKGSAFGSIGEEVQPTNEQFENNLFAAFSSLDHSKPIWLENESRNIGRVYLPESLWLKMRASRLYNVKVNREVRLDRALNYYSGEDNVEELKSSFNRIKKRLGGLEYQNAMKAIDEHDMRTAAAIALTYYDKSYTFQLQNWNGEEIIHIEECDAVADAASHLISQL